MIRKRVEYICDFCPPHHPSILDNSKGAFDLHAKGGIKIQINADQTLMCNHCVERIREIGINLTPEPNEDDE